MSENVNEQLPVLLLTLKYSDDVYNKDDSFDALCHTTESRRGKITYGQIPYDSFSYADQ